MPSESYNMLGELTATLIYLEQVYRQLAAWHERVIDGVHYEARARAATGLPEPSPRPPSLNARRPHSPA